MALNAQLSRQHIRGITQTTPSYNSLLVCFEPEQVQHAVLQSEIHAIADTINVKECRGISGLYRHASTRPTRSTVPHWRRNYRKTGSPSLIAFAPEYRVHAVGFFRALLYLGNLPTHCTATVCGIREQRCLRHRLPLPGLKPAFIPSTRRADGGS